MSKEQGARALSISNQQGPRILSMSKDMQCDFFPLKRFLCPCSLRPHISSRTYDSSVCCVLGYRCLSATLHFRLCADIRWHSSNSMEERMRLSSQRYAITRTSSPDLTHNHRIHNHLQSISFTHPLVIPVFLSTVFLIPKSQPTDQEIPERQRDHVAHQ